MICSKIWLLRRSEILKSQLALHFGIEIDYRSDFWEIPQTLVCRQAMRSPRAGRIRLQFSKVNSVVMFYTQVKSKLAFEKYAHPRVPLSYEWRRIIGCLIFIGLFLQKSPVISGSVVERDLEVKASSALSPSCMRSLRAKHTRQKDLKRQLCSDCVYQNEERASFWEFLPTILRTILQLIRAGESVGNLCVSLSN